MAEPPRLVSGTRELEGEGATEALGAALARGCRGGEHIHLRGPLGSGKTTLVRGFLRACGHAGPVKSPTYTFVEPYPLDPFTVYHLDLYRLEDPGALEFLGAREILGATGAVTLIEWPERGGGGLPAPDIEVTLDYAGAGRRAAVVARSPAGEAALTAGSS